MMPVAYRAGAQHPRSLQCRVQTCIAFGTRIDICDYKEKTDHTMKLYELDPHLLFCCCDRSRPHLLVRESPVQ
jgi:hypothetical protein